MMDLEIKCGGCPSCVEDRGLEDEEWVHDRWDDC